MFNTVLIIIKIYFYRLQNWIVFMNTKLKTLLIQYNIITISKWAKKNKKIVL